MSASVRSVSMRSIRAVVVLPAGTGGESWGGQRERVMINHLAKIIYE